MQDILSSSWFLLMDERYRRLVRTAILLYEREHELELKHYDDQLQDYSFIIFPMSKAYEGFLKQMFLDIGLIDRSTFEGKRFRIGKALNPDLYQKHRDKYWLFDDIEQRCGSGVAHQLWDAWLQCRNRVFHFYVNSSNVFSLKVVEAKLQQLSEAMQAFIECGVVYKK